MLGKLLKCCYALFYSMNAPYVPKWDLFAYVCSSECKSEELVDYATGLPIGRNVLLVLRYDKDTIDRIGSAYLNMMVRFNDNINKYKKRSMEMLMFLYSDHEIGRNAKAVKLDSSKFILFSDSKVLLNRFVDAKKVKKLQRIRIVPGFES